MFEYIHINPEDDIFVQNPSLLACFDDSQEEPLEVVSLAEKSYFMSSYKEAAKQDPLIQFALQFATRKGIYRYIEALGQDLTWQQMQLVDAYARGDSRIACVSGKGPGKCSKAGSLISTLEYGRIEVEKLEGKSFHVLSLGHDYKLHYKPSYCELNIIKDCTELTTESGNTTGLSSDHPVFTQRGWIPSGQVVVGDMMVVPRTFDIPKISDEACPKACQLIGYLQADGCTSQKFGIGFTKGNKSTVAKAAQLVSYFGGDMHPTTCKGKGHQFQYNISGLLPFARKHGLMETKSINKQIPATVWRAGKEGHAAYLKAFFECDGYSTNDGYEICLASHRLMLDLQFMLESFGIYSNVRYKKSKCEGKEFDAWRLSVSGASNLKRWVGQIGEIKEKPLPQGLLTKKSNTNVDSVPIYTEQWRVISREMGHNISYYRKYGYRGVNHAGMGREKWESFVKEFKYNGMFKCFADSDIRWVKVTKTKSLGMKQTWAVTVPGTQNFVSDNLVVHNTHVMGILLTHWNLVHPMSMLIVTAPTFRQCKEGWMSRAEKIITDTKAHPSFSELFTFRGSGFGILGHKNAVWGCQLITARNKEAFQGIHQEYLCIAEDESSGVPLAISEAAAETFKNPEGTFLHLKIGNGNSRLCKFFDAFNKDKALWTTLHWNAEETPESAYFSQERNREIAEEFGKNSDIYKISVLGEFPSIDPNCLIAEDDLNACTTQEALNTAVQLGNPSDKRISIDLARYGGDENSITVVAGNIVYYRWAMKCSPLKALDKAVYLQNFYGWQDIDCLYVIDTSGMGEVAADEMGGSLRRNKRVHEFYSQGTPSESSKFEDKISEAWCALAKLVRKHEVFLGSELDHRIRVQLCSRRYIVTTRGKIKVESKDDYKKQFKDSENGTIGQSPDRADSLVMAFTPNASVSVRVAVA